MKNLAFFSILLGVVASFLVFTEYFKTPSMAISIFSVLGIIAGLLSLKLAKTAAIIGLILNIAALVYLIILFVRLSI